MLGTQSTELCLFVRHPRSKGGLSPALCLPSALSAYSVAAAWERSIKPKTSS